MNRKLRRTLFIFSFSLYTFNFLLLSCNTTEPPIKDEPAVKDTITIQVTQTTHRSITLNITSTFNKPAKSIELYRRRNNLDSLVESYTAFTLEKEIIDDDSGKGLIIDTEYKYFAVRVDTAGNRIDTSEIITARTLPATSHDYTWEEFTIGDEGYSNVLYDVWGTDEDNVYAVGNVTINDTTYSVIHWDGNTWEPSRKSGILRAVYGFSKEDIWAVGTSVNHYDGMTWHRIDNDDVVLHDNKEYTSIWGTSSDNLYLGNGWGKIVHWDGSKGSLEEVPSDIGILDIYGYSENFILAAGNNFYLPGIALEFNGTVWNIVQGIDYSYISLESVYVRNSKEVYYAGSGIIEYFGSRINHLTNLTRKSLYKIRGNKRTADIFAVGHQEILHFNGRDWKSYRDEIQMYDDITFYGLYLTNNKVFIVGLALINQKFKVIILIGTR